MNCYYHPETIIVATCQDCNKGLCKNCSDRFTFPICVSCNSIRGAAEKKEITKELALMIGLPIIGLLFMQNNPMVKEQPFMAVLYFYMFIAIVAGWRKLNKFTSNYFLFLPVIGWVIYFLVKLYISAIVGLFIAPFRIYRNINRLKEISQQKNSF